MINALDLPKELEDWNQHILNKGLTQGGIPSNVGYCLRILPNTDYLTVVINK